MCARCGHLTLPMDRVFECTCAKCVELTNLNFAQRGLETAGSVPVTPSPKWSCPSPRERLVLLAVSRSPASADFASSPDPAILRLPV